MHSRSITVSIISHGQNALANQLLADLRPVACDGFRIVLTENIRDSVALETAGFTCPVDLIVNEQPRGFGANHNRAFARCQTQFFCVVNPDVRIVSDPFPALLEVMRNERIAVSGPLVRAPNGKIEDNARRFPTTLALLRKLFRRDSGPDYPTDRGTVEADWLAGMFLLFRSDAYRMVDGFDERYFLYYEDVDICRRLRTRGKSAAYVPTSEIVHDARRASRRDLRLAWHHVASAVRFLSSRD